MSSIYHVTMMDGSMFEVATNESHVDHADQDFRQHLAKVIAASAAVVGGVRKFDHRGPSENTANRLIVFGGEPKRDA